MEETSLGSNFLQLAQVLFQCAANPLAAPVYGSSPHSPMARSLKPDFRGVPGSFKLALGSEMCKLLELLDSDFRVAGWRKETCAGQWSHVARTLK